VADASVQVLGYDELARGSRQLADKIEEAAPAAFHGVAEQVAAQVAGAVPHRSGALAGDVQAVQTGDGAAVGYAGGVPYAGWIDFGGGRGRPYVPAGRYLFPIANDAADLVADAALKVAEHEIGGMHWPTPT
jgi:hypothetical protein